MVVDELAHGSAEHRRLAEFHAVEEARSRQGQRYFAEAVADPGHPARTTLGMGLGRVKASGANEARMADYHAAQERRYLRAASRPWEAPGPGPPKPR